MFYFLNIAPRPGYLSYNLTMKHRKTLLIVIVIIVAIVSSLLYAMLRLKAETAEKQEAVNTNMQDKHNTGSTPQQNNASSDIPVSSTESKTGKYVDYSAANFAAASSSRRIIFFHAPWCPQCRELEKSVKAGTIPAGWVILKTDYDTSDTLKQKYGVTLQTTMVEVDNSGNLKEKFVAYDEPSLRAVVKALGE